MAFLREYEILEVDGRRVTISDAHGRTLTFSQERGGVVYPNRVFISGQVNDPALTDRWTSLATRLLLKPIETRTQSVAARRQGCEMCD